MAWLGNLEETYKIDNQNNEQYQKKINEIFYNFKLIDKPIIAGCPKGGIILDPFCGTGTTLVRAMQLGRQGMGIDGNQEYCEIAQKRIEKELKQLKLSI